MKCTRCEKEFPFEVHSIQEWLHRSKLYVRQLSFILYNFGGLLWPEYETDLQSGFYLSGVNPY